MNSTNSKREVLEQLKAGRISVKQAAQLICQLGDAVGKAPMAAAQEPSSSDNLYAQWWEETPMLAASSPADGRIALIFHPGLGESLANSLRSVLGPERVTMLMLSQNVSDISTAHVDQDSRGPESDPYAAIRAIQDLSAIYYLGGIVSPTLCPKSAEELDAVLDAALLPLFRLVKAVGRDVGSEQPMRIKVVTNNVGTFSYNDHTLPYAAPVIGFSRVVAKEYPELDILSIDIDLFEAVDDNDELERIAKNIGAEAGYADHEVMLRNGRRYVHRVAGYAQGDIRHESAFKRNGVYVIVGAGGIAVQLGSYLVDNYESKVVLVGRRSQQDFAASHAGLAIRGIDYLQGDITSLDSMTGVMTTVACDYGGINGVVHSAIVLDDSAIENMSEDRLKAVLRPKVTGTWVLGEATKDLKLDFIALFSSANAVLCSAGQGNYVAGCWFKDHYGQFLNAKRDYPVITIDWGYWGQVGAVADEVYRARLERTGIHPLETAEGMDIVERLLANPVGRLMPINLDDRGRRSVGVVPGVVLTSKASHVIRAATASTLSRHIEYPALDERILEQVGNLNRYTLLYLVRYFSNQQIFSTAGNVASVEAIRTALGLAAKYARLLDAMLHILEQATIIERNGDSCIALAGWDEVVACDLTAEMNRIRSSVLASNDCTAHMELLDTCLNELPDILSGKTPAVEVIFPNGSMRLVEGIYRGSSLADHFNWIAASAVRMLVETLRGNDGKVRILEIGAGTGGASKFIFEQIKAYADDIEYVYTDVSVSFLNYARNEYASRYPFVQLKKLDIEKSPSEQGFEESEFDIVFASNVLHATRSIQSTLENVRWLTKGQGKLVLNEITGFQNFTTMTFGLLDGWWAYLESDQRVRFTPLLSSHKWEVSLNANGFSRVQAIGSEDRIHSGYRHHVLISEQSGVVPVEPLTSQAISKDEFATNAGDLSRESLESVANNAQQCAGQQVLNESASLGYTCLPREFSRVVLSAPSRVEGIECAEFMPAAPGRGQVQIRVHACALNFSDLLAVKGLYPNMPEYPFTPGLEISGVIIARGPGVVGLELGEEVVGLAGSRFGGLAEVVNVASKYVVSKPATVNHQQACAFPVVFLTAQHAVKKARLRRGESILIQTAAGGTGLAAVQLAKLAGAEIYATAGSEEKLDYLRGLGIRNVINYRTEDFEQRLQAMTQGRGVDVVLNMLAGDFIQKGINVLAPGGRYVEIAMTGLRQATSLDLSRLTDNQEIISIDMSRLMHTSPDMIQDYLYIMKTRLQDGAVKPTVGKVYRFDAVQAAFRHLEQRANIGKVVVDMSTNQPSVDTRDNGSDDGVAVIGMAGRFPGAPNIAAFLENLKRGAVCVTQPPENRWSLGTLYDPERKSAGTSYSNWGAFLEDVDAFDSEFFHISGREAAMMDPQQRLMLEETWKALEDAGYRKDEVAERSCGVFIGASGGDYQLGLHANGNNDNAYSFTGNAPSILAGRISYFLNFKGPSIAIDTACSSSLVAIHQACQSIRGGECELAVAGGVFIMSTPTFHVLTSQTGMLSPTGVCSTFDRSANGFVPGEAAVALVLKPYRQALADGDRIHAVIRGSGVNQDGETNGITAPSATSQTELLKTVYGKSNISPDSVGYIETHGTGTKLGDPIEIAALKQAFAAGSGVRTTALGSVKPNTGHAATAAGAVGFVKAVLAVREGLIFPQANYSVSNDEIELEGTPFYIPMELKEWRSKAELPRRAAVSSFGFSGTNSHVIVEQATANTAIAVSDSSLYIATLSAKSPTALMRRIDDVRAWLTTSGRSASLFDICYTLNACRSHLPFRAAMVVRDVEELGAALVLLLDGKPGHNCFLHSGSVRLHTRTSDATSRFELEDGPAYQLSREQLSAIAQCYVEGESVDWDNFYRDGGGNVLDMPTYPFEREHYWLPRVERKLAAPVERRMPDNVRYITSGWTPFDVHGLPCRDDRNGVCVLVARPDQTWAVEMARGVWPGNRTVVVHEWFGAGQVGDMGYDTDDYHSGRDRGAALAESGLVLDALIDVTDLEPSVEAASNIKAGKLGLIQVLLDTMKNRSLALVHCRTTQTGNQTMNVSGAFFAGLFRSLRCEHKNIHALAIQGDSGKDVQDALSLLLDRDLATLTVGELKAQGDAIAQPLATSAPAESSVQRPLSSIDHDDICIVTGAYGGIGRHVIRHLVDGGCRKLVMIVRERTDTDRDGRALSSSDTDHYRRERTDYVEQIRGRGVSVYLYSGAIDDREQISAYLRNIKNIEGGNYVGVVHCAGTVDQSFTSLLRRDHASILRVTQPKIQGLLALDAALEGEPLRFFVLCSSVSTAINQLGIGVMDYAAANYFMDEFARYQYHRGKKYYRSIQWAGWEKTGLNTFVSPKYKELGLLQQTPDECLNHIENIVAGDNLVLLPAKIDPAVFDVDTLLATAKAPVQANALPDSTFSVTSGRGVIRDIVRRVLSQGLNIADTRIRDETSFSELGVDSIILAELVHTLEQQIDQPLQPAVFLEYPTVAELVHHLEEDLKVRPRSAVVVPAIATADLEQSLTQTVSAKTDIDGTARDLADRLRRLLAQELHIDLARMVEHASFRELGVDSNNRAELATAAESEFGVPIESATFVTYPTIGALVTHLTKRLRTFSDSRDEPPSGQVQRPASPESHGSGSCPASSDRKSMKIAIIGMDCIFPGAEGLQTYWENLANGVDSIGDVPPGRWDDSVEAKGAEPSIKRAGFIDGMEYFDADYFGLSRDNATQTDPLIRKFLEVAAQTFRDAGYDKHEVWGKEIGVFVGSRVSHYAQKVEAYNKGSIVALAQNFIAAHVSDFFNLTGPSMVIDSACSSSLTSFVMACRALAAGDCAMALAGGVDILLDDRVFVLMTEAKVLSPDAKCYTFDQRANGFVPGEGCGAVLLKPLDLAMQDGDRIYAVVEAAAMNNDGNTMGITTPSLEGQKHVIQKALTAGSIDPSTINYVEAHGTATMIGDPIELKSLNEVYRRYTEAKQFCAIGSVKTNVGHMLSAAGIGSVIKVALALQHKTLPPTLHCEKPNNRFSFEDSPFYPVTELTPWLAPGGIRRAGISSFGFGGTNCHVIATDIESCMSGYKARRSPLSRIVFKREYLWPVVRVLETPARSGRIMQFKLVQSP